MIPSFVRRCPECGAVRSGRRFAVPGDPGVLECPACHHRFEPVEEPWLM